MPTGPQMPTIGKLQSLADRYGLDFDTDTLASYRQLIGGTINACRYIERFPEQTLAVKYPRDAGSKPQREDNPHNAWAWRCDIKGAASGILKGYKVAVKDAIAVAGLPMRNGSKILEGYTPDIDATVVTRILDAGGRINGKTNCEDLCFSGSGHTSAQGYVENPYDPSRNPGASSSGSAVVLATGEADLALGGDQGGSIRLPASWSGVVGLKPTYGLVPYTGCATIENTLDHAGPMATSAEGIARLLQAIAGPDPLDHRQRGAIPARHDLDYLARVGDGIKGKRIAIVREGFAQDGRDTGFPPADPRVDDKVKAAVRAFEKLGATVEEVSIPMHLDAYYLWSVIISLGSAEFMLKGAGVGSNFKGYYASGLGEAASRALRARPNDLPASAILSLLANDFLQEQHGGRYYWKAQNQRHLANAAYDGVLEKFDMLAMPTIPFTATQRAAQDGPLIDYVATSFDMLRNTCVANLTGHPSISLPCGMIDGLPVGLMLTGRQFEDSLLIRAAAAFETLGDWKQR